MIINTSQEQGLNPSGQSKLSETRAIRYTCQAWFPVNPDVLKSIRKDVREGKYRSSKELLDAIRQDFALFGFLLKEIGTNSTTNSQQRNLVKHLQVLSLPELKALLPVAESRVSNHRFTQLNEMQKLRLQHFVISSATVEALIERAGVDTYSALCAVFFRQLGYALVCWNYPRIYYKAMETSYNSARECDLAFEGILGFSPFGLGIQLAKAWGTPKSLIDIIERMPDDATTLRNLQSAESPLTPEAEAIARLCNTGEANARSHDPSHYRCATIDTGAVEKEATRLLGSQGLVKLQNYVRAKWSFYSAALQRGVATESDKEESVQTLGADDYLSRNVYIQSCTGYAKRLLQDLYSKITPGHPSPQAIKLLIEKAIPGCSFDCGCIYLVQESNLRLVPNIIIGAPKDQIFRPAYSLSFESISDPVERSRTTQNVCKGQVIRDGVTTVIYLAAPVGSGGRGGVLYLETSYSGYVEGHQDVNSYFRAIHLALCDALNLPSPIKANN